jgi:hypothetical protein
LVAYLETLVAFSPIYLAADTRTQGKIENFYRKALDHYKDFTYKEFHKYIARKMEAFYKRHGFPKTKADKEEPEESEEPEVGDVVAVDAGAEVNKSYAMSDGEDDEDYEGEAAAAAASDADGEAAAADAAAPDAAAAAAAAAAAEADQA